MKKLKIQIVLMAFAIFCGLFLSCQKETIDPITVDSETASAINPSNLGSTSHSTEINNVSQDVSNNAVLATLPDITLASMTGNTSCKVGVKQNYTCKVKNIGATTQTTFYGSWFITNSSGGFIKYIVYGVRFLGLTGGGSTTTYSNYTFQNAGTYRVYFYADDTNLITESNENNNQLWITVTVTN